MTGRERLDAILHRRPADRLSWTALVDDATLGALPEPLRGMSPVDFYRYVGCDILLLNTWPSPDPLRSPDLRWGPEVEERAWAAGGQWMHELRTPKGTLTSASRAAHPLKRAVTTLDDLRLFRELWEGALFVEHDDRAAFAAAERLIGDDGVVTRFWGPSTIPRLLELDMGPEAFYYLLADYPEEMDALISLMHEREIEAFEMLARGPCDVVILVENTSTYYIGPQIYRRYNGPHVRDFVDTIHAAGKVAIVHMCGHIRDILPDIRATGLDGVHALTPPPTGNTPWEEALDVLGPETILISALDPTVFLLGPVDGIGPALDALLTPRIRRSHFVLGVFADGIPAPLERFQAVARWMEKNGSL